jgi:hypothetical protein
MPNLLDRHRQTTMTQQFQTEKRRNDDDSLPPNWGRFQDPATGRYIFRHSTTHEVVFKMKHLFKKKPGARKNRPEDSDAATPPSKKKKKIKDEETEVAAPDVIPSIPVFITPPTAKHRTQLGGANSMDPIELLSSNSSSSSAKNEELSDLSETEAPFIPSQPADVFQSEDSSSGTTSNGNGLPNTEDFQYILAFQKAQAAKQSSSGTAEEDGNSDDNDDDDSKTLV